MEFKWGQIVRFITVRIVEGIIVVLLILFMPNIPPYCKISDSLHISPSQPLAGKLATNERLNDVVIWHKGDLQGPESFADYNGELYCSLQTGEIVKLVDGDIKKIVQFGKPCKGYYEEKICGRPLGMQFNKNGTLTAVDAYYGLFQVNIRTGDKEQLVSPDTEINGKKPKLPNALALASNGDIYWSDSSTEFLLEDGIYDMLADGSGRLIHYNSNTKKNTVLIDKILFANGVALSDDEEFVLISESGRSRVHRYYIQGPKKGTSDIFIDGLPGIPDNINSDGKGGFFFPLIVARDENTPVPSQILAPFPLLRKLVVRMMALVELGFSVANQIYQHEYFERGMHLIGHFSSTFLLLPSRVTIVHVSKTGEILDSLHANNRKALVISEAYIFEGDLYLGSPFNDFIARTPLRNVGLEHLERKSQPKGQVKDIPTTTPKATTTTSAPTKASVTTPQPTKPEVTTTKPPTTIPAQKKETVTTKPTEPPKVTAKVKPAETQKAAPKPESAKPTEPPQANKQEKKPAQSSTKQETKSNKQESKQTETNKQETKPTVSETNKQQTKPTASETNKQQTKPTTSQTNKQQTNPTASETNKQQAKPTASGTNKQQTKPTASETNKQQTKPTASETKPPPQEKKTSSSPNNVPK